MTRLLPGWATALLILIIAGCSSGKREDGKTAAADQVVVKGVIVETAAPVARAETIELTGTVKARTSAVVSARVPGMVKLLHVREGDRVKKGQTLALLEAQETDATAAASTAGVDEAVRAVNEAISRRKLADSTFARYEKLFNEQAVTRQEFEIKQNEKELAAQGVGRAEARLRQARESSNAAVSISGHARITAPISGVISSKSVDLGSTVFPAQVLMTVEDEGSYQLELAVPESLVTQVKRGTPVRITLDALKTSLNEKISEVVPAADPSSRTFTVKVALAFKGLRSGMFGHASINLDTRTRILLLPQKAIVERGALTWVWVVENDKRARMRLIKVGKVTDGKSEVVSGLTDGERVVVGGAEKVTEGATVE